MSDERRDDIITEWVTTAKAVIRLPSGEERTFERSSTYEDYWDGRRDLEATYENEIIQEMRDQGVFWGSTLVSFEAETTLTNRIR